MRSRKQGDSMEQCLGVSRSQCVYIQSVCELNFIEFGTLTINSEFYFLNIFEGLLCARPCALGIGV